MLEQRSERTNNSARLSMAQVSAGLLGTIAGVLALVVSRGPIGVVQDSAIYLGTADNLLAGRGPTSPITLIFTDYFTPLQTVAFHGAIPVTTLPPGYPVLVAAVSLFGPSLEFGAKIVGAVSLAVCAYLLARITTRLSGGAWVVGVAVVVLFLAGGPISQGRLIPASWLWLSALALSEVSFLAITLATLMALAWLLRDGGWTPLILTGLGICAAIMVRFMGIAILATALMVIMMDQSSVLKERLQRAVTVSILAIGPVLVWLAALALFVGRGEPSTPLRYHSIGSIQIGQGAVNAAHWIIPTNAHGAVAIGLGLVVVAAVVTGAVLIFRISAASVGIADPEITEPLRDPLFRVLIAFGLWYLAALIGAHLTTNNGVTFDVRFIAPVRVVAYVLVAVTVYRCLVLLRMRVAAAIIVGLAIIVVLPSSGDVIRLVRDGAGSVLATPAPGMAFVRDLPDDAVLVSNSPEQVWIRTHRSSALVPIKHVAESDLDNPRYRRDLDEIAEILARPNSYLIMAPGVDPNGVYLATTADIEALVPLDEVASFPDAIIYRRADAG